MRLKELIKLYIYSFRVSPIRLLAPHTTSRCFEYPFSLINLPIDRNKKILDIGPSFEFFTYLFWRAKSVVGLDPSTRIKKTLERFKKKYHIGKDDMTLIQGDITKAPFPDNFFDIIKSVFTGKKSFFRFMFANFAGKFFVFVFRYIGRIADD